MTHSLASLMGERSDVTPRLGLMTRDVEVAKTLSLLAYDYGFELTVAEERRLLLERASEARLDLILVDLSDEGIDETDRCDALQLCVEASSVPTIALSYRSEEADRLRALHAGVVDYVQIPFSTPELAARLLRILSRTNPDLFDRPLAHGDILMEVRAEKVFRGGEYIRLKRTEFKLLHALMQRPQQVHTREELLAAVFENPEDASIRTIDVSVLRLREALSSPQPGSIVRTVRSLGYSLDKDYSTSGDS